MRLGGRPILEDPVHEDGDVRASRGAAEGTRDLPITIPAGDKACPTQCTYSIPALETAGLEECPDFVSVGRTMTRAMPAGYRPQEVRDFEDIVKYSNDLRGSIPSNDARLLRRSHGLRAASFVVSQRM